MFSSNSRNKNIVGICPFDRITFLPFNQPGSNRPKTPLTATFDSKQSYTLLEPNHSNFLLIDSDSWSKITETVFQIGQIYSKSKAGLVIIINGDRKTEDDIYYSVKNKYPIIIIEGR